MPNKNKFESTVTISSQSVDHLYSVYKDAIKQKNPSSVVVDADATFGGYLTGNMSFYSGLSMKGGLSTWIKPNKSPVLINHASWEDPIGRIYKAKFLDIEVPKGLEDVAKIILKTKKIKEFTEAAHKAVNYQHNHSDFKGFCKVGLTYKVTDLTAIPKILDERYLTVSSSFVASRAFCSICGQNYVKDGYCDHRWGATYEDEDTGEERTCFRIAFGDYKYGELSYVNFPSFDHAVQTSVEMNDSEMVIKDSTIHVPDISLFCSLGDCACADTKTEERNQEKDSINEEEEDDSFDKIYKSLESFDDKLSAKECEVLILTNLQLLKDYKGTGDRKKIRNYILRKAKKMAIKVTVKDMKDIKAPEKFALLLSDSLQSYEVIKSCLSEDKWLDSEKLEGLKDEDFAAPNRMIPMVDKDHKDAIGKLLEELSEDEECKVDYTFELIKDKVDNFCPECDEKPKDDAKPTDKKDITIGLQKDKIKELTEKISSREKEIKDSISNELLFVKALVDKDNYDEEALKKEMDSQDIKTIKARITDNKGFLKDFVPAKKGKEEAAKEEPVTNPITRTVEPEDGEEERKEFIDNEYKTRYKHYGKEMADEYLRDMKLRGYVSEKYNVEPEIKESK